MVFTENRKDATMSFLAFFPCLLAPLAAIDGGVSNALCYEPHGRRL